MSRSEVSCRAEFSPEPVIRSAGLCRSCSHLASGGAAWFPGGRHRCYPAWNLLAHHNHRRPATAVTQAAARQIGHTQNSLCRAPPRRLRSFMHALMGPSAAVPFGVYDRGGCDIPSAPERRCRDEVPPCLLGSGTAAPQPPQRQPEYRRTGDTALENSALERRPLRLRRGGGGGGLPR